MTQQEIQERNKQIALMLGYKTTWLDKLFYTWKCRFLYDWNLLMEAIEFIEKLNKIEDCNKYDVSICLNKVKIDTTDKEIVWTKAVTKKEAVFIAVSDFAKLYNEKKL
jgi:hypothetical protein